LLVTTYKMAQNIIIDAKVRPTNNPCTELPLYKLAIPSFLRIFQIPCGYLSGCAERRTKQVYNGKIRVVTNNSFKRLE